MGKQGGCGVRVGKHGEEPMAPWKGYLTPLSQNLKYFVYEVLSRPEIAIGGPFPGTTIGYPNKFDDWIHSLWPSGVGRQQLGIALARPNPSGAPGGQLIQIDWTRFGGNVLSENWIRFVNYVPYINGVACRRFE
jgi:hypothetical protein